MALCPRRNFYGRWLLLSAFCCSVIGLWFNLSALGRHNTHLSNQVPESLSIRKGEPIETGAEKGSVSEEGTDRGFTEENETEARNLLEVFSEGNILLNFGDDLCALSPEKYEEDSNRTSWEDTILSDLYWKSSHQSHGSNSEEPSESYLTSTDIPITNPKLVAPVSRPILTGYRMALAFASAKIDETKKGDILNTCNFVNFTKKESQHLWRLAERRVGLEKVCRSYASFFKRPLDVYNNLLWDTSTHLGYCAVFKTGTTSWMSRLVDWKGVDSQKLSTDDVHTRVIQFYPALKPAALAEEIEEHQPLLFTVARHPFIRVVSAYVNRICDGYLPITRMLWIRVVRGKSFAELMAALSAKIGRLTTGGEEVAYMQKLLRISVDPADNTDFEPIGDPTSDSEDLTFREFVRWIIWSTIRCLDNVECLLNIDEHWQPQYVQCSPCTMRYDVISKMETFDDDANMILKVVGRADNGTISPSGKAWPPTKRRNISLGSSAAQTTREYLEKLTPEEVRLLYVAYYLDFKLFGFSPVDIV